MLEEQLTRAKSLLDEATKATGIVNARALVKAAPGMEDINAQVQDYDKATILVRQASAELASTKQFAADLAGPAAAKKMGDEAMVPASVSRALKELGKQVEIARKAPHADLVPELFKAMDTALAEGKTLSEAGQFVPAGEQLKLVGDALVKARTIQCEHERFQPAYDALALKLTAFTTSTVPPAAKLKGKTDPIAPALKAAEDADKAHDWTKAFKALNTADIAVKEAQAALDSRKTHDDERKVVFDKADILPDPAKAPILAMITKADDAADAFNFAHAKRFLANAGAQLAGASVKDLAKATPLDIGKIEAAIQTMLDAVGGDELMPSPTASPVTQRNAKPGTPQKGKDGPALVDEIVKGFDDTVPAEVIIAIAKKRFGIDLAISALQNTGAGGKVEDKVSAGPVNETAFRKEQTKRSDSARSLYNTLAMTPEQSDRNPSLKTVERKNAVTVAYTATGATYTADGGGWYEAATNKTVMKGRPGVGGSQAFGAGELATDGSGPMIRTPPKPPQPWDEKTTKEQAALAVYEPADATPVDFFEFANVHETGHSVDDRMGFMMGRLGNVTYGGWQLHGGDLGAVAIPVAAHYAKLAKVGDTAPALKQFVIDTMTGAKPEIPVVDPEKQQGVNEACDKITTEWYPNANVGGSPWWSQGKTDKITMDDGRVYQESYAGRWSSYPASERSKGITGYQFRAPGEWFAELFSAYHHEKLKPGHPARKWLSSLQL